MFGNPSGRRYEFEAFVDSCGFSKGKARHAKYMQRILPNTDGFKVDIFVATSFNWGWILALRTGSSDFNQNVLLPGLKVTGHKAEEGVIYNCVGGKLNIVELKDELDLFKIIGLVKIPPHLRKT